MPTYHIHIQGQVQGVGFRPFVYKIAINKKIVGWVNNSNTGVHIEVTGNEQLIKNFYEIITKQTPKLSIITNSTIKQIKNADFKKFEIIHSHSKEQPNLLLTPDYGICQDCLNDIFNKNNRRFLYSFTTCTNCGPRYSIIKNLPYDRETTTMENFKMCNVCQSEYDNPLDRRYYSQTNSCADCAVELSVIDKPEIKNQEKIVNEVVKSLKLGKIVAIKGIGGYVLLADATSTKTIETLRKRKHRPTKPFALMYHNDKVLLSDVNVSKTEWKAYKSIQAPIILFSLKKNISSNLKTNLIAPNINQIGVMNPYTPLYAIIVSKLDFPIIATSANVSDSPIIFTDKKAEQELSKIADIIVANNREIVVPQDDSVIKFSKKEQQKIIIRRSRSLSPTFIDPHKNINSNECLLAMGAGLKSSFTFYHQKNTYISQYLGNLNSFESQESFEKVLKHYFSLFKTQPSLIVTDKHPQYFSTQFGQELKEKYNTKIYEVQHHKAHFTAVLAENGLINTKNDILGIIWDGVGLGDDNNIWGGEFFKFNNKHIQRLACFEYFSHIALDKFAMEPRLVALSVTNGLSNNNNLVSKKFNNTELTNYQKLIVKNNSIKTSSVGRLFDAVASLIELKDVNSYEGEAAMILENIALKFYNENINCKDAYKIEYENNNISIKKIIAQIIDDINNKENKEKIAFKFHLSLINTIKTVANNYSIKELAFSGGVFQNSLLLDLIIRDLSRDFKLYFHKQLSPNDENISFGQLVYVNNEIK